MVLLHWTKWQPERKQEKPQIGISYSTEAITFMANLSSGEWSRAIMALLFDNYIAIQVVNKLLPVVVVDFARVALMFELFQYYLNQEKFRGLCGSAIN